MTLPRAIRANVNARFPTRVQGSGGITVTKQNGIWTITPNFAALADYVPPSDQWPNTFFWAYNSVLQSYSKVSISSIQSSINANAAIEFVMAGVSAVIPTGVQGDLEVPFNCEIVRASLLADQVGNLVVDIWKDTYANYPPAVGDSITAAAKPTLTGVIKSQDSTLTGWTKTLSAGDVLRFNVDAVSAITRATLSLEVNRT